MMENVHPVHPAENRVDAEKRYTAPGKSIHVQPSTLICNSTVTEQLRGPTQTRSVNEESKIRVDGWTWRLQFRRRPAEICVHPRMPGVGQGGHNSHEVTR